MCGEAKHLENYPSRRGIENTKRCLEILTEVNQVYDSASIYEGEYGMR
jgi:hypothetical protein